MMAREKKTLRFTFENPNDSMSFERVFRKVLVDRILAERRQCPETV